MKEHFTGSVWSCRDFQVVALDFEVFDSLNMTVLLASLYWSKQYNVNINACIFVYHVFKYIQTSCPLKSISKSCCLWWFQEHFCLYQMRGTTAQQVIRVMSINECLKWNICSSRFLSQTKCSPKNCLLIVYVHTRSFILSLNYAFSFAIVLRFLFSCPISRWMWCFWF